MNTENTQKQELEYPTNFFDLDNDKSESKITGLIGKDIAYDLKYENGITLFIGKLLKYENNLLKVKLVEDWEEDRDIHIDNIIGIEEISNPDLEFKKEYENQLCEITNQRNQKMKVIIKSYDGVEISMDFVYDDDTPARCEYIYPLFLLKSIEVVK